MLGSSPMTKVNIPLPGRTFERTQGCWNCKHYGSVEASLQHWKVAARPQEEARIAKTKQEITDGPVIDMNAVSRLRTLGRNNLCTCGSQQKYKRCHMDSDRIADQLVGRIKAIEEATRTLDGAERAIADGYMSLCLLPGNRDGDYKSDAYLCDKWSGAEGASVARAGQKADMLPEELKEIHGDGNLD